MEVRRKVTPIEVRYKCPKCAEGYLIFNGRSYSDTFSATFTHECNKCGCIESIKNKKYPCIIYEPEKEPEKIPG